MERTSTVIVGGGPAGIATGAALHRRGFDSLVLEKDSAVAPTWRRHYERLHLHTNKRASGLPGRPMPGDYPKYPSRDQVADYLVDYAKREGIRVRLNTEAVTARRQDDTWVVVTANGDTIGAPSLVIATGLSHTPHIPRYPKQELYEGRILHSADYRNGEPFRGQFVLVVGFGNSGAEIALDLAEHGAHSFLSVRSPAVVVPRDILGIPILSMARWLSVLPPRLADWLSKPLLMATVGDISRLGIPRSSTGPLQQIATQQKIPMIDVGTMAALRQGSIRIRPGIDRFNEKGVMFTGGVSEPFDAVIFATGYKAGVEQILESTEGLVDEGGRPLVSGGVTSQPGLYFCGFREPPTGRLREIGIEAERIASLIAANVGSAPATT